jgi:hypothetical protein
VCLVHGSTPYAESGAKKNCGVEIARWKSRPVGIKSDCMLGLSMNQWLRKRIAYLRELEPYANEGDMEAFTAAADIVREARCRLIDAGRGELAKICQADWAISPITAQDILSQCLKKPEDPKRINAELLTLQQAAGKLGYTEKGLRKIVKRGEIRFMQAGPRSRIKFRPEWLDEFIDQKRPKPEPKKSRKPPASHGFDPKLLS